MSGDSTEEATQNRKDAHAAGIYAAGRSIAMLMLVLTAVAANHLYGQLGYAYVTAIILIYETSMALGSLGLPDAVFYFIGRYPERAGAIVRQTSWMLLLAALPVTLIAIGSAIWLSGSDGKLDLIPALPWLALVILIELPTQPAVNQLIAHGHAGTASLLYAGFAVLRAAAVLAPAVTGWSLTTIPMAMALLGLTRLVAHLVILRRLYPMPAGERWRLRDQMREIFFFALPGGVAAGVGKLNPQIDKYAVQLILGTEALAIYGVAAFELPLITLIPYAIGAVMQVRYVRLFAAQEFGELKALWFATVEKSMVIVIPLAVVVVVMARELITIIFTPESVAAVGPFQIFTIVLLHRVASYGAMLQASNQTRLLFVTSALIVGSNLLLQWPLTRLFGMNGPAMATALANAPAWLFTLDRIGKIYGRGLRDALPWGFYLRTLVICGLLGVALWQLRPYLFGPPWLALIEGLVAYAVTYVLVGRLTGVLRAEDTAYLRRIVRLA